MRVLSNGANPCRKRPYLGVKGETRTIFNAVSPITQEAYGDKYEYVVGPFKTLRGAVFMRDHGVGNPHCRCVGDAEILAKKFKRK